MSALTKVLPGSFQPDWLPNCVLWLRADQGITLGTGVSNWKDLKSNGTNYAYQATGANQPTLNLRDSGYGNQPTIVFSSASDQYFYINSAVLSSQPFTIYVVGESTSGTGQQQFFSDATNNVTLLIVTGSGYGYDINAGVNLNSLNTVQATAYAFGCVFNGTSSGIYQDESSSPYVSGNAGTLGMSGAETIGCKSSDKTEALNGKIAEMVWFTGAHNTTQVSQMFKYFGSRYGKTWS